MPAEAQAILFALGFGVVATIWIYWGPIKRQVFLTLQPVGRLLHALAQRYLNLPELRRIMSREEESEDNQKTLRPLQSDEIAQTQNAQSIEEPAAKVDIMIHDAVYRAQVETTAKILHFARQQNKKLSETRILEDVFKVSSGSNKKWYSVHGDVMRELAKHAPVEEEKPNNADRMVAVSNNRMVVPEAMTDKDKQTIEQAQERYGDQIDEKRPESEKTDEDVLKYKPLVA